MTAPDGWRSRLRTGVVAFLSLFTVLMSVTDIALPWHPTAEFGFQLDAAGKVLGVTPDSPASRAGIVAGDAIDMRATPFGSRPYLQTGAPDTARPGTVGRFVVLHGDERKSLDLIARTEPQSLADDVTIVLVALSQLGLVVISAFLVIKRPSLMTWAFLLYADGSGLLAVTTVSTLPASAIAAIVGFNALYNFPWLWLAIFALRFPNDEPTGWRRGAERAILASLVAIIPLNFWFNGGYLAGYPPHPWVVALFNLLGVAGLLFAAFTFVATYLGADAIDRARLRWVMLGIVLGSGGGLAYGIATTLPGVAVAWPIWLLNLVQASEIIVGLTVVYAVVRHRVFDVRFFIGRAVLYSALTSVVVVTLQIVDYTASKMFSSVPSIANAGQAGAAILLGLSLKVVHAKLEKVCDSTFFKSRLKAQRRIERLTRGMSHTPSLAAIREIVVTEPATAFKLTSAAIFTKVENGTYERGTAIGWDDASLTTIEPDAPLVLQLLAAEDPVPLGDVTFAPGALPPEERKPSNAMSMRVRSDLEAIVFYGPHDSQEELDPDEIETLEGLLRAAASAYDHVRAAALNDKLEQLETEIQTLRGSAASNAVAAAGI